ncbi:DNA-binding protein [Brachybacterium endophyticum]|uniref:DNA-binding protein n=1 Tax=Brachybacterium endophyticum TaxID=2182385 RepID=A0A2U2RHU8_9MICO|nr:helix-turn-helix domain-containing protein [Brachybacterium endophyticum]PWH05345.1 DNA-binding protein [Brachybacterium endophyticum]
MTTGDWLTTGETASMLGVSRQHVVDLCDRGELSFSRTGSHRRVRRTEVERLLEPQLTREQEKSLWLHRALLGPLMREPETVLDRARENIRTWQTRHRPDGMASRYLTQWNDVIDGGVDEVAAVLTSPDEHSSELRQNTPFAGVLPDRDRVQVLRSFREHWDRKHAAA